MDIDTGRRKHLARETILNGVERLDGDQCFMLAGADGDIPFLAGYQPGIEFAHHDAMHLLVGQIAMAAQRKFRVAFKEAFDLRLGIKATGGISIKPFGDNRSYRFIAHQHGTASGTFLIFVAHGRIVDPEALQHSAAHPRSCLFGIHLALILRQPCHQPFVEDAVGVGLELPSRGFERGPCRIDHFLEIEMMANVARHSADVIYDDDDAELAVFTDEGKHFIEAGALRQLSRELVRKNGYNIMLTLPRIFTTNCFLRNKTISFFVLLLRADAAVNYGVLFCFSRHDSIPVLGLANLSFYLLHNLRQMQCFDVTHPPKKARNPPLF